MGDIAKQVVWKQDTKLQLLKDLPELGKVLAKVREVGHITPGLLSHLYHTEQPSCQDAKKRRYNFALNPNDLACLGEDSIGTELQNTYFTPELNLIRKPKSFVGLKNLGATCYMNCMLQALFHNTEFREGVYAWTPEDEENFSPVVRQLQLLFASLQAGVRAYYDPTPFTTEIGLATQVQQDVQEFFKALTTYLEDQFGHAADPKLRRLVQDQFCGTMAYVTQCKHCQTASKRKSSFYELDMTIDGVPSIERSIENYTQSELLNGTNQYHCGHCDAKRDAERFIQLCDLPPILNFQLMRFVFDWQTETKKKVKTSIEFPEILDMSPFVRSTPPSNGQTDLDGTSEEPEEPHTRIPPRRANTKARKPATSNSKHSTDSSLQYQLSYVLVHRGQSAYGGHYIAFVRDEYTNQWWKFNDEEAAPVDNLSKALASNADIAPGVIKTSKKTATIDLMEEEVEEPKSKKTASSKKASASDSKTGGGERYKSGSAYMLGYTQIGRQPCNPTIPESIAADILVANSTFQTVVDDQKAMLTRIEQTLKERMAQRNQLEMAPLVAIPDDETLPLLPHWMMGQGGAKAKAPSTPSKSGNSKNLKFEDLDLSTMTELEIQDCLPTYLRECRWILTEWLVSWHKGGKLIGETEKIETSTPLSVKLGIETSTAPVSNDVVLLDPNSMEIDAIKEDEVVEVKPKLILPHNTNESLMCAHGRLDPTKITLAKRISVAAWDLLVQWEGIGPELDQRAFCTDCALAIVQYGVNKIESDKSKDELLLALKAGAESSNEIEPSFWISKDWLSNYSKKTVKIAELDPTINGSLQCPHGNLSAESRRARRRIPATQWVALRSTFPAAIEFPSVLTTAPVQKLEKEVKESKPAAKSTAKNTAPKTPNSKTVSVKRAGITQGNKIDHYLAKPPPLSIEHLPAPFSPSHANSMMRFAVTPNQRPFAPLMEGMNGQSLSNPIDLGDESHPDDDSEAIVLKPRKPSLPASKGDLFAFPDDPDALHKPKTADYGNAMEIDSLDDHDVQVLGNAVAGVLPHAQQGIEMTRAELEADEIVQEVLSPSPISPRPPPVLPVPLTAKPTSRAKASGKLPLKGDSSKFSRVAGVGIMNQYTEDEAEEHDVCKLCYQNMRSDNEVRLKLAKEKTKAKKYLSSFLKRIPSSMQSRDGYEYSVVGNKVGTYYLVDLSWAISLRNFLKEIDDMRRPLALDNSQLFCEHSRLILDPLRLFGDVQANVHFAVASTEEMGQIRTLFGVKGRAISVALLQNGRYDVKNEICQECVDLHRVQNESRVTNFEYADLFLLVDDQRSNKRIKTALQKGSRSRTADKNLISRISYFDSIGTLKMRIFEKYDVVPAEMILVSHESNLMDDDERPLEYYGVRSDHPITVQLVDPMDRDIYRPRDERNAGFGTTVLMGGKAKTNASEASDAAIPTPRSPLEPDSDLQEALNRSLEPQHILGEDQQHEEEEMDLHIDSVVSRHKRKKESSVPHDNHVTYTDDALAGLNVTEPAGSIEMDELISSAPSDHEEVPLTHADGVSVATDDENDADLMAAILASKQTAEEEEHAKIPLEPAHPHSLASKAKLSVVASTKSMPRAALGHASPSKSKRPSSAPQIDLQSSSSVIGNWICYKCKFSNSSLLMTCEECNTPSSDMSWKCSRCNILVRAAQQICPQCHSHRLLDDDDEIMEIHSDEEPPKRQNKTNKPKSSSTGTKSSGYSVSNRNTRHHQPGAARKPQKARGSADDDDDFTPDFDASAHDFEIIVSDDEEEDYRGTPASKKRRAKVNPESLSEAPTVKRPKRF